MLKDMLNRVFNKGAVSCSFVLFFFYFSIFLFFYFSVFFFIFFHFFVSSFQRVSVWNYEASTNLTCISSSFGPKFPVSI
jgi:hypothetical protein